MSSLVIGLVVTANELVMLLMLYPFCCRSSGEWVWCWMRFDDFLGCQKDQEKLDGIRIELEWKNVREWEIMTARWCGAQIKQNVVQPTSVSMTSWLLPLQNTVLF